MRRLVVIAAVLALLPASAYAQGAPTQYGQRIPAKVAGWYAPVGSNLIGSDEKDHLGRGSVNAWDWSAAVGSPVFAIGPGVVTYAGCNNAGGYGCWVKIDHGAGFESSSAHCLQGSIRVQTGQQVDASSQICNIGRTGMTSWPHVHLVIKKDGVHQRISNFFDVRLVRYCFFTKCQATNDPAAPVTFGEGTWLGRAVSTANTGVNLLLAQAFFAVMFVMFLLAGQWLRVVIFTGVTLAAAVLIALPRQQHPLSATPMLSSGLVGWEQVYPIIQSNEGWSCTHDPVRTMGGVTQSTYNRWRASYGLGGADVCANLTRAQAKAIYYERYWLASGADRLPVQLALTHTDMAVNAGVGVAMGILSQCGSNVACYNASRVVAYRGMSNCSQFCRAWENRVNKIRKYTGG